MLKIDNCEFCAALTHTRHTNLQALLSEIEKDDMGCWLCMEDGRYHMEFDIFDRDKKIWCGHIPQCLDVDL